MKVLKEKLGQEVCSNMLFIHAILGCDTTSRLYGIGRGVSLKKFFASQHFRDLAQVFNNTPASKEDVVAAGEKALVCVYNGKSDERTEFSSIPTVLRKGSHEHFASSATELTSYISSREISQLTCVLPSPTVEGGWRNHVSRRMGMEGQ